MTPERKLELRPALVHHRVGHFNEAGDVRAVHVMPGVPYFSPSGANFVIVLWMYEQPASTSSRSTQPACCSAPSPILKSRRPAGVRRFPRPEKNLRVEELISRRRCSSACSRLRRQRRRRSSTDSRRSLPLISFWVALGNAHSAL